MLEWVHVRCVVPAASRAYTYTYKVSPWSVSTCVLGIFTEDKRALKTAKATRSPDKKALDFAATGLLDFHCQRWDSLIFTNSFSSPVCDETTQACSSTSQSACFKKEKKEKEKKLHSAQFFQLSVGIKCYSFAISSSSLVFLKEKVKEKAKQITKHFLFSFSLYYHEISRAPCKEALKACWGFPINNNNNNNNKNIFWRKKKKRKKTVPPVRIELTTFRLWDWRAAYCAKEARHVWQSLQLH